MANQTDAAKTDPLTGMAHSEAHYFNRYAVQSRRAEEDVLTTFRIVTTTMVRYSARKYLEMMTNARLQVSTRRCWYVQSHSAAVVPLHLGWTKANETATER
jgi:hypothetical protein